MTYTGKYEVEINAAAAKYNLDPELIACVIQAESSFNPKAGSGAGAKGLMQLMPGTFKSYGKGDIWNPMDNIMAGSNYLAIQIKTFGSIELGLAAYNAGPTRVKKYNGIPPIRETQMYVAKIMTAYKSKGGQGGKVIVENPFSKIGQGQQTLDNVIKSPILWVALLIMFLIK